MIYYVAYIGVYHSGLRVLGASTVIPCGETKQGCGCADGYSKRTTFSTANARERGAEGRMYAFDVFYLKPFDH